MEKNDNIQYKVLMFGPERVGKSSVLASMIDQFEKIKNNTGGNITLTPDESTAMLLEDKKMNLQNIFKDKNRLETNRWPVDSDKTPGSYDYDFVLSIEGAEKDINITFTDIPGEWLKDSAETDRIHRLMDESTVIIVAIDTPHLIECDGDYKFFNYCDQVSNFLSATPQKAHPRLVLFVPIKCEKYYHENRMEEVNDAIKKAYKKAIFSLRKGTKKDTYMVAITPIITLGDVIFDDFLRNEEGDVLCFEAQRDENGKVVEFSDAARAWSYMRPKMAYYKFYGDNPVFSPKYCEQPLLYTLNFILQMAKVSRKTTTKKKKSGLQRIFELFLLIYNIPLFVVYKITWDRVFSNKNVIETVEKVIQEVKIEGDGYEVIQNPFKEEN